MPDMPVEPLGPLVILNPFSQAVPAFGNWQFTPDFLFQLPTPCLMTSRIRAGDFWAVVLPFTPFSSPCPVLPTIWAGLRTFFGWPIHFVVSLLEVLRSFFPPVTSFLPLFFYFPAAVYRFALVSPPTSARSRWFVSQCAIPLIFLATSCFCYLSSPRFRRLFPNSYFTLHRVRLPLFVFA